MGRHNSKKVQKIVEQTKVAASKKIKKSVKKNEVVKKDPKKSNKQKAKIVAMPAIVSDIDGVIIKGKDQIPGARQTLETLINPVEFKDGSTHRLPFVFLTNGGGITEKAKIDQINKKMDLKKNCHLPEEDVILCHTVLRDPSIQRDLKDKFILVDGIFENTVELAKHYGYTKAMTMLELESLFPSAFPHITYDL